METQIFEMPRKYWIDYVQELRKLLKYQMTDTTVKKTDGSFWSIPYKMTPDDRVRITMEIDRVCDWLKITPSELI